MRAVTDEFMELVKGVDGDAIAATVVYDPLAQTWHECIRTSSGLRTCIIRGLCDNISDLVESGSDLEG